MEYKSEEMIFSRTELQYLANAIVVLMSYDEKSETKLGGSFPELINLLGRFNEQIDNIDAMKGEI